MAQDTIKTGIIGAGNKVSIASAHLAGYQMSTNAELVGVFDIDRDQAKAWCAEKGLPEETICHTLEDLLHRVNAVSICTPNATHVELIHKALQHKVNVLCEKPVGVPQDDLDRLLAACEESSAITMVNFNYRRLPALRQLQAILQKGEVGDVWLYRHTMGGDRIANQNLPFEWRMSRTLSGSGSFGDFGSHMLDMVYFLLGEDASLTDISLLEHTVIPQRPYHGGIREVENDDCSVFQGRVGRTLASFMTSRIGTLGNRLEIIGSRAIVQFDMQSPATLLIKRKRDNGAFESEFLPYSAGSFAEQEEWKGTKSPEMRACSENVMLFVQAVSEQKQVQTDIPYGIRIQRQLDAIEQIER